MQAAAKTPESSTYPRVLLLALVAACVLPILLHGAGVDFASYGTAPDRMATLHVPTHEFVDSLHSALRGSFTHTVLEWTAFCTALFTLLLSLVHYSVKRDSATLLIGIALLGAGCIDAWHTLAADGLIPRVADNRDLVPITWAVGRTFNAIVLVGGVFLLTRGARRRRELRTRHLVILSAVLGIASVTTVVLCTGSASLPRAQYAGAVVTRPFDLVPLALYVIGALFVMPRFCRQSSGVFAHALVVAMIPQVATQLHMAFGSSQLFDAHFNIAHFLKIVAYLVPFSGLCIAYIETFRHESTSADDLLRRNSELSQKNQELDEFTYAASHDLQEPLRKLTSFSQLLQEDLSEEALTDNAKIDLEHIISASNRMRRLIQDLIGLSRAGRSEMNWASVPLQTCVDVALDNLSGALEESGGHVRCAGMPLVRGDQALLTQLFQNLISNGLKFTKDGAPEVRIAARRKGALWMVAVEDDGIGIKAEHRDQVFAPFQRLHSRASYEGTGIGLAICQRAIQRHGGKIWIDGSYDKGTRIVFTLSAVAGDRASGEKAHA